MTGETRLIYIHDPMCSWCWGFRPSFERLRKDLPAHVTTARLLGGLAPDSEAPMPVAMRHRLEQTWRTIQLRIPGGVFNFDFWRNCRPRRSTWPACRAVIAARRLDPAAEEPMIAAIQRAYYLQARNPSDRDTLIALAGELGLSGSAFAALLDAADTQDTLAAEIGTARRLGADSFPSLRLAVGGRVWPIAVDYTDPSTMRDAVHALTGS